ncbi:MAG: RsmE family RNA methyltransferase [Oligoflexales bacterium]|nr:RsmE family RNA methyltransferase [Oligoflexales bacterium]
MAKHKFRFFAYPDDADPQIWILEEADATHCQRVLKLPSGSHVEATNGQGMWVEGFLTKKNSQFSIQVENLHHVRKQEPELHLALGVLQPRSFEEILPGLCENAINHLHLILSNNTNKDFANEKLKSRWSAIMKSAVKQSKQAWVPTLYHYRNVAEFVAALPDALKVRYLLMESENIDQTRNMQIEAPASIVVMGSESGFAADEVALFLKNGFRSRHVGNTVLRAKTCALGVSFLMNYQRSLL